MLVVNMLIDGHRGLAEQLASCDLPTVLQSCWWDRQSAGCPHAMLALGVINRLAEHRLPLGLEMAGSVPRAPPATPWPHGCSGQGCLTCQGRAPRWCLSSECLGWARVSLSWQAERPHWT